MEILASHHFLTLSPLSTKSLPLKNPSPLSSPRLPKRFKLSCSISISPDPIPPSFNGWDDPDLIEAPAASVGLHPVRRFLVSSGLDDSKLAVAFCLGFLSSLAVSRVRFSLMLVLPVSVLVFVVGFSAGVARVRVFNEKVRDLESFIGGLMSEVEKGASLGLEFFDERKMRSCLEAVESMRRSVEGSIVGEVLAGRLDFDLGGMKKTTNAKPGSRRKELDFFEYIGALFQENVIGAKMPKSKDNNSRGDATDQIDSVAKSNGSNESIANGDIKGRGRARPGGSGTVLNKNQKKLKDHDEDKHFQRRHGSTDKFIRDITGIERNRKANYLKNCRYTDDVLSYDEQLNSLNGSVEFMKREGTFKRRVFKHNYEHLSVEGEVGRYTHSGGDERTENMDFLTKESQASSLLEETLEISDNTFSIPDRRVTDSTLKGPRGKSEDQSSKANQQSVRGIKERIISSSSASSVDEEFTGYVQEATDLLDQARECMRQEVCDETAESILYKSASLLSAAEVMRPMSLLAVGLLGNTYLLHGELKLQISRQLRTLLLRNDTSLGGNYHGSLFKKLSARDLSREDVESSLVEVCEECEELLVGAGRKYRTALSIDGNDVRALYNWGLALSYRAQLIADIGPEAALDADKIYLAAIDKFDAMTASSDHYATDALYRWGVVLQQRSYLRPRHNREKMKLLHQAKSLFEDVLSIESDNPRVREALVSCVSELNYNGQW